MRAALRWFRGKMVVSRAVAPRIWANLRSLRGHGVSPREAHLLGLGNLVSSITVTGFYLALYQALGLWWQAGERPLPALFQFVWYVLLALFAARAIVCLLPQNGWFTGARDRTWALARNVPLLCIGAITLLYLLFWYGLFLMAAFVAISFACYLLTIFSTENKAMQGMLMCAKSLCYVALVWQLMGMV